MANFAKPENALKRAEGELWLIYGLLAKYNSFDCLVVEVFITDWKSSASNSVLIFNMFPFSILSNSNRIKLVQALSLLQTCVNILF